MLVWCLPVYFFKEESEYHVQHTETPEMRLFILLIISTKVLFLKSRKSFTMAILFLVPEEIFGATIQSWSCSENIKTFSFDYVTRSTTSCRRHYKLRKQFFNAGKKLATLEARIFLSIEDMFKACYYFARKWE